MTLGTEFLGPEVGNIANGLVKGIFGGPLNTINSIFGSGNQINSATALQDMVGYGTDERNRQFNAEEAEKNRQFNSAEALLERDWQEHMRDTNYTSAYKQMEEAGFNPVLAFMEGQANAPAGANATGVNANFGATSAGNLANNVSNLLGTYMLAKNAKLTRQFWQAVKFAK